MRKRRDDVEMPIPKYGGSKNNPTRIPQMVTRAHAEMAKMKGREMVLISFVEGLNL